MHGRVVLLAVVIAAWVGLVLAYELVDAPVDKPPLCRFRGTTGVPCPTCGSTRAVLAIARGELPTAFMHNPLLVGAVLLLLALVGHRVVTGRWFRPELSAGARRGLWIAAIVLFAANWAWVIWRHA